MQNSLESLCVGFTQLHNAEMLSSGCRVAFPHVSGVFSESCLRRAALKRPSESLVGSQNADEFMNLGVHVGSYHLTYLRRNACLPLMENSYCLENRFSSKLRQGTLGALPVCFTLMMGVVVWL